MNTNLLDLIFDIWNIIGDYVKKDNLDRILKQDMFDYVDIKKKIKQKEARKEIYYISRSYTRYLFWVYFVEFCNNRCGFDFWLIMISMLKLLKVTRNI